MSYGACWAARRNYELLSECISNFGVHEMSGHPRTQNLADRQLQNLVVSLNAVHEGKVAIPLLFIAGERAVRPLRDVLLQGGVTDHRIPRVEAVWALAELGAREVLLEYLATPWISAEPDLCHAEKIVRDAVARALTAWDNEKRCPLISRESM